MEEIKTHAPIARSRGRAAYKLLIAASFFLYIVLTTSKNLYVAEKTTLQATGSFGSFTDLAMTMEYYFYVYAVTQLLLVFFIKRINIKWFLTVTVAASAVLTVLMSFTTLVVHHYIIYSVNGFLQGGIWGFLLKILSMHLPAKYLAPANQIMSAGPASAGALSYAVAAIFGSNWRLPFLLLGIILLGAVLLYFFAVSLAARFPHEKLYPATASEGGKTSDESKNDFIGLNTRRRVVIFYAVSVLLSVIFTSLYFMVNNNLDIFLKQVFSMTDGKAKLLTIVAPLRQ
jgi:sugar phosphate permease